MEIYAGDQVDPAQLLHSSKNPALPRPLFAATNQIEIAARPWTIVSRTTPLFERRLEHNIVPGVRVVGTIVSFILFGITGFLVRAREAARKSEEALGATEEPHRTVAESATDGIIVIDAESHILSVSGSAERIFGYTKDEVVGQSVTMLMPERMRSQHRTGIGNYLKTGQKHLNWHGVELPGQR